MSEIEKLKALSTSGEVQETSIDLKKLVEEIQALEVELASLRGQQSLSRKDRLIQGLLNNRKAQGK